MSAPLISTSLAGFLVWVTHLAAWLSSAPRRYQDPDSVLRALAVLNGVELPDLSDRSNPGKKLIVSGSERGDLPSGWSSS